MTDTAGSCLLLLCIKHCPDTISNTITSGFGVLFVFFVFFLSVLFFAVALQVIVLRLGHLKSEYLQESKNRSSSD